MFVSDESSANQAPVVRRKATTLSSSDDYSSSEDGDLFADKNTANKLDVSFCS